MATTLRSFVNDLGQVVQQAKGQQALALASGSTATMEQYNRKVGRMEGMEEVVKLAREMLGQMESAAEAGSGLPEMPNIPPPPPPPPNGEQQ
jgi:hypothetical protein